MSCCSESKITAAPAACGHDLTDGSSTLCYTAQQCSDQITPESGCSGQCGCEAIPEMPLCGREYRLCVDQNGCAARYPAACRNPYWPNFSHPRWLPCSSLYCSAKGCNNKCR